MGADWVELCCDFAPDLSLGSSILSLVILSLDTATRITLFSSLLDKIIDMGVSWSIWKSQDHCTYYSFERG